MGNLNGIEFSGLAKADLVVDAVYMSDGSTNLHGDVLSKLLGVGNQGGFRKKRFPHKSSIGNDYAYIVLESTNNELDWIDTVDYERGIVQYYGDNREPGRPIHETSRKGNELLYAFFEAIAKNERIKIPPVFYFLSENGRNRKFIGLLVPGHSRISPEEQLTAIWRRKGTDRYENYKAVFTILNVKSVKREWIDDLLRGKGYESSFAPAAWKKWIDTGVYSPLESVPIIGIRTKAQQKPAPAQTKILEAIYNHFMGNSYEFERCAIEIVKMMDENIIECQHTRFYRDGGRDALGKYKVGDIADGVVFDFALEAKCYGPNISVGVKEVSRLISRLRFRQFGILVTTSFIDVQAYKEIKEDQHPIIIVSGGDIVKILYKKDKKTVEEVEEWLNTNF